MPRCLHPEDTFDIVLESDEKRPEAEQPFFTFRALSIRQWRDALKLVEQIQKFEESGSTEVGPTLDAICNVLRLGMVGWSNMYDHNVPEGEQPRWIPFDAAELDNLLDIHEANELMQKMMAASQVSPEDKKKLGSPPTSAPASSAKVARTVAASKRPRK